MSLGMRAWFHRMFAADEEFRAMIVSRVPLVNPTVRECFSYIRSEDEDFMEDVLMERYESNPGFGKKVDSDDEDN